MSLLKRNNDATDGARVSKDKDETNRRKERMIDVKIKNKTQ
jgi:hypothetical protein